MISMIVAYANNRVIGKDGKTPWHLPAEMRYFKRITSDHTVVMGRKTFEAIGRPLSNRRNVVLTHRDDLEIPGVEVVHNIQEVLELGDVFILGGEEIYRQFLGLAHQLYITTIALDIEGDAFFPEWDPQAFTLISEQAGVLDEKNRLPHTFYIYERK